MEILEIMLSSHPHKVLYCTLMEKELIEVLKEGKKTRAELCQMLHKPRSTIYDHIELLIKNGVVKKEIEVRHVIGHPLVYFKLNPTIIQSIRVLQLE